MASNGFIPLSDLRAIGVDVEGDQAYLASGAAADYLAMDKQYFLETGGHLWISGGGGAYRTYVLQEYYYDQYINHGGNNAAEPGTSNHGWGKAIDIFYSTSGSKLLGWLQANAGRYGYENNYPPEAWHWQHLSDSAFTPAEIIVPIRKETEMIHLISDGKVTYMGVEGRAKLVAITDKQAVADLSSILGATPGATVNLGGIKRVQQVESYLALAKP